jgi:hypothetical protein
MYVEASAHSAHNAPESCLLQPLSRSSLSSFGGLERCHCQTDELGDTPLPCSWLFIFQSTSFSPSLLRLNQSRARPNGVSFYPLHSTLAIFPIHTSFESSHSIAFVPSLPPSPSSFPIHFIVVVDCCGIVSSYVVDKSHSFVLASGKVVLLD